MNSNFYQYILIPCLIGLSFGCRREPSNISKPDINHVAPHSYVIPDVKEEGIKTLRIDNSRWTGESDLSSAKIRIISVK